MSTGKVAAQSVHAALGLALQFPKALDPQLSVVVLEASDASFNTQVEEALYDPHTMIYVVEDAGKTEVPPGTKTVAAFLEE